MHKLITGSAWTLCFAALAAVAMAAPMHAESPAPLAPGSMQPTLPPQSLDRCPATLSDLGDFVRLLQERSRTPMTDADDTTVSYDPANITVLGTRLVRFQAYFVRGQPRRLSATVPGRMQLYEAVLPKGEGADVTCGPERCEWLRTDEVPRGTLIIAYLGQDRTGRNTIMGCGYLH